MTGPVKAATPAEFAAPTPTFEEREKTPSQFRIKRTRSEVGYVYWVLEGYGKHKCFVLCDSWEEAMEQAKNRLESEKLDSGKEDSQEFLFADGL